jgi:ketosteroid isomerase-like protein
VFAQGPRTPAAQLGDLVISQQGDFAVASFDAGSGMMHARRTLVLRKVDGQWRIVHLHASNVAEPG